MAFDRMTEWIPARTALRRTVLFAIAFGLLIVRPVAAQTTPGNLTDLMNSGLYAFNGLEIDAAHTNDAAYAALLPLCGGAATNGAPGAGCTGNTLNLFDRLRELEDTANALLKRGQTTYSLGLGPEALGLALRWTAPEEFAAQGSMTNKFANSQMTTLTGRFSALRFSTQMSRLARGGELPAEDSDAPVLASYASGLPLGGGASADAGAGGASDWSNWSAFGNGSYSAGAKAPTVFEDAFNYNDTEYSAGSDLRLNSRWVVGVLAGHSTKNINFNSSESTVNGGIRGEGYSGILYAQYEADAWYLNLSGGLQHLSLDTRRSITYPSLNPLIPSVNETSTSSTSANSWIANLGAGYTLQWRGFSAEPYLNAQYIHTQIAQFIEHDGSGFDVAVAAQSIPSMTTSLGLKFQQAFLPTFGVIVPYVYGEARHEFLENSRTVQSVYADSGQSDASAGDFNLPTDAPTRNYYVAGGGLNLVFKHNVQAFLQYMRVFRLVDYSDYVASGGIRIEF